MSTYRVEWPCCGSVTETDAWEPESCPFCAPVDGSGVLRLKAANVELLEALDDAASELEALAKARDSDYARPDPDCITRLRAAIAKATGSAS